MRVIAFLGCFLPFLAVPAATFAQQPGPPHPAKACGPRAAMASHLKQRFGEVSAAAGIQKSRGRERLVELFVSPNTGTWTVLGTVPGGQPCMIMSGTHWMALPPGDLAAR